MGTRLALLPLLLLFVIAGCTRGERESENAIRPGQRVFAFDYKVASQLSISKADPQSDDRWTARLERSGNSATGSAEWRLGAGADGKPLPDSLAHHSFINHLLDTLSTVQVAAAALEGPPEAFGLATPHYAIRWRAEETEYELRVGDPVQSPGRSEGARYCSAKIGAKTLPPFVATGAVLRMVEMVDSFNALRLRSWGSFPADDVDEVELRYKQTPFLYAQRHGDGWVNRQEKPISADLSRFLESILHARIERFVDDPAEIPKLQKTLETRPLFEAVLTDRQGKATSLRLQWTEGPVVWASSSARPSGVFGLYPRILELFHELRTGAKKPAKLQQTG